MNMRIFISALAGVCVLGGCAPRDTPEPPNTAYLDAKDAAIRRALATDDRVNQINMQKLQLEIALDFLAKHLNVDMVVDWDALARRGIDRDGTTTTINLFDATYAEALEAVLWQLRPSEGQVRTRVFVGRLFVLPLTEQPPASETAAQLAADERVKAKLKKSYDLGETGELPLDTMFYGLSFAARISLIVDWDELAKVGVKRDAMMALPLKKPTGEAFLKALMEGMKPTSGAVGYDIRGGVLRVSTQARLDAERAVAKTQPG